MNFEGATYCDTRKILTVHGKQYTVKQQRNRLYIHAENKQITVTQLIKKLHTQQYDIFRDYILSGAFLEFPCHAVEYWLMKYRQRKNITPQQYKRKFLTPASYKSS